MRLQSGHVLGRVAARQQATVHFGVQGFHTAVQHLGELGDFGHFGHGQALLGQQFGGAAGRDQAHAQSVQFFRQIDDAGFVRDRDEGSHGGFLQNSKVFKAKPG
jgi:hypothetical protein